MAGRKSRSKRRAYALHGGGAAEFVTASAQRPSAQRMSCLPDVRVARGVVQVAADRVPAQTPIVAAREQPTGPRASPAPTHCESVGFVTDHACVADPAVCGDGIVERGEACDDGNTNSHDGCRGDCLATDLSTAGLPHVTLSLTMQGTYTSRDGGNVLTLDEPLTLDAALAPYGDMSECNTVLGMLSQVYEWQSLELHACAEAGAKRGLEGGLDVLGARGDAGGAARLPALSPPRRSRNVANRPAAAGPRGASRSRSSLEGGRLGRIARTTRSRVVSWWRRRESHECEALADDQAGEAGGIREADSDQWWRRRESNPGPRMIHDDVYGS